MKIIKVYKNGTIRLPQEVINKLNLKHNDKLVIICKHDGFVVCKIEYYNTFFKRAEFEIMELDLEFRKIFAKSLNSLNKKEKDKTEVL